jgi:hypothetical protein
VISDIDAARNESIRGEIAVIGLFHDDAGVFHRNGAAGHAPGQTATKKLRLVPCV